MQILKDTIKTNKNGQKYALGVRYKEVVNADKTISKTNEKVYTVFTLKQNYAGHVRGGLASTWRYVGEKDLTLAQAILLLNKKAK